MRDVKLLLWKSLRVHAIGDCQPHFPKHGANSNEQHPLKTQPVVGCVCLLVGFDFFCVFGFWLAWVFGVFFCLFGGWIFFVVVFKCPDCKAYIHLRSYSTGATEWPSGMLTGIYMFGQAALYLRVII